MSHSPAQLYTQPTFLELFTPKLITVFREGYGWRDLRADAVSGLTVAVVALPLSMAIAIASGVSPERGLYTAIAGGLIISLIGGSPLPDRRPGWCFCWPCCSVVERHGYDGLALATVIAGLVLITVGLLRVGTYIKYIRVSRYNAGQATNRDVMVYQISGAFFFGATARVLGVLDRVGAPRLLVLDFKDVPLIDTTAARSLVAFVNKLERLGTSVVFAAARPTVRRTLNRAGLKPPLVRYSATAQDAVAMIPQ